MTEQQKADGRLTQYAYNGLSQVVRRTDSLGHELRYHYDGERNLEWEYDKVMRLAQVDQDGQVICHEDRINAY